MTGLDANLLINLLLLLTHPWPHLIRFDSVQAYGYDDHGISERWMQTYIGKSAASDPSENGNTNSGGVSGSNGNGNSQALCDEASRMQVMPMPTPMSMPVVKNVV